MSSHFFALVSRMKFINRWALMRNVNQENLCEHSFEVAIIAHSLCIIGNERLGKNYDANKAAVIALYHDFSEILTGDMPTPVKYKNEQIKNAYKSVEKDAQDTLLNYLPTDLQKHYSGIICNDEIDDEYEKIVKAADKISALIKCTEELKMGNSEFLKAKEATYNSIKAMNIEEADVFLSEFIDSYSLTLDELN